MRSFIALVRDYLQTALLPFRTRDLLARMLPTVALAIMSAVLLVHAFSPSGLSVGELVTHAFTVWLGFLLGMVLATWVTVTLTPGRTGRPTVGLMWFISATGFVFGLVFLAGFDTFGFLADTAAKAESLHGPQSMLLRLVPVWALVTGFLVRTEVLNAYESRLSELGSVRQKQLPESDDQEILRLGSGKTAVSVRPADVLLVSAEENYCKIVTRSEGNFSTTLVRSTLQSVEEQLPDSRFIRVHRSHVVNVDQAERIKRRGRRLFIALTGFGEEVPISRQRFKAVLKRLEKKKEKKGL